jgi:AP endonuclease-2
MRILSWNVNGVRTIKQYYPWNTLATFTDTLNALDSDIICFQEIKCSKATIPTEYTYSKDHNIFYSLSQKGYSGVGTYCSKNIKIIAAEVGLSGLCENNMGCIEELHNSFTIEELASFDIEGRVVITDHQSFILFNVYFPCHSEGRLEYKLKFQKAVQVRVNSFIKSGREVILVGDVNIAHRAIDHCDPMLSNKENQISNFDELVTRKWFNGWLANEKSVDSEQTMIDSFRYMHSTRKNAFTCWNTKINARPANYGTRIDYCLVSKNLKERIKSSDISPEIMGSDHCPIYIELLNDHIQSVFESDLKKKMPKACTRYWDNFGGRQMTMDRFLVKKSDLKVGSDSLKPKLGKVMKQKSIKTFIRANNEKIVKNIIDLTKEKEPAGSSSVTLSATESELATATTKSIENIQTSNDTFLNSTLENQQKAKQSWGEIMKPKTVPNCLHQKPCVITRCLKGVNKNKSFYQCSLMVAVGPKGKCNFFQWS